MTPSFDFSVGDGSYIGIHGGVVRWGPARVDECDFEYELSDSQIQPLSAKLADADANGGCDNPALLTRGTRSVTMGKPSRFCGYSSSGNYFTMTVTISRDRLWRFVGTG
jgi:hypothetical protein